MRYSDLWNQIRRNPYNVLGIQKQDDTFIIRILNHAAQKISIINENTAQEFELTKDSEGFFSCALTEQFDYLLKVHYQNQEYIGRDPYSFPLLISDFDLHLFHEGTHRKVWNMMGAHPKVVQGINGVLFSVWAPNASSVRVVGDFNSWDQERYFMQSHSDFGIWEIFIPNIEQGEKYKFAVEYSDGRIVEKSDPYAVYSELRPNNASVVFSLDGFAWNDHSWMNSRTVNRDKPLSIYECHLGSWIKNDSQTFISYRDIAEPLAEYLLAHGFTHVELMPITEYPFDGSWGYQVTGYYAPTSRYGTPKDFMYFVDYFHQKGLGVIMDWVPAHFPQDIHGLARFDGTALYEHEDSRLGWHQDWQTYIFNYGRHEVRQFLIGSALYWMDQYHIDGLRVDAVASMLYLDYSRKDGEWLPNKYGGRENLEAIEFLQSLNTEVQCYFPTAMTIAEESTSFYGVTSSPNLGGLGFTFKWNMGWMNDTLQYFSIDPLFRSWHHNEIMFSLVYSFSEHFILPFSHDEVVHGKGSLLDRMPGNEWEKFANLRLMFSYMWAHPGKKLLFASQEWAPWEEWREDQSIDWHLNEMMLHTGIRRVVQDLNSLYKDESALYQIDTDPYTFSWLIPDDHSSELLMWIRRDSYNNVILIILNLNTILKEQFRIGVPFEGFVHEIFNSDRSCYGGANILNHNVIYTQGIPWQGQDQSLLINIGPLAAVMFKIQI